MKKEDLQDKKIQSNSNGYITRIYKVFYTIWLVFITLLSVYGYFFLLYSQKDTMEAILLFVLGVIYPLVPFFITYCAKHLFKKSKILFSIFLLLSLCFYGFFILGSFFNNDYIYIISGWLFLQILSLISLIIEKGGEYGQQSKD